MHVIEPSLDFAKRTVVSDVLVDLDLALQVIYTTKQFSGGSCVENMQAVAYPLPGQGSQCVP